MCFQCAHTDARLSPSRAGVAYPRHHPSHSGLHRVLTCAHEAPGGFLNLYHGVFHWVFIAFSHHCLFSIDVIWSFGPLGRSTQPVSMYFIVILMCFGDVLLRGPRGRVRHTCLRYIIFKLASFILGLPTVGRGQPVDSVGGFCVFAAPFRLALFSRKLGSPPSIPRGGSGLMWVLQIVGRVSCFAIFIASYGAYYIFCTSFSKCFTPVPS